MLLAVLVVLHHSAQPYGPGGGWWIASDPHQTAIDFIVLGLLMTLNMSFFMGLFFMISAYFVPISLDRKGYAKFMKDRLVKLGTPLLIFMLGVFPLMDYLLYHYGQPIIHFYLSYVYIFNSQSQLSVGHLWFLAMLLIFSAVYIAYRLVKRTSSNEKRAFPGNAAILAFGMAMALISFVVRIWAPINYWVPFFKIFEPFHLTRYIMLFAAGIVAYREGWIDKIPEATAKLWSNIVILMIILLPVVIVVTNGKQFSGSLKLFSGGLTLASLTGVTIDPLIKFAIVGAIGVPLVFAISHFAIRRQPFAKYILG